MGIPKIYTTEELAEALGRSVASLERDRANLTGPNFIRLSENGAIRYLEEDVVAWLHSLRQNQDPLTPATPQAMRAAALHGLKEVSAAHKARVKEMQDLDREDTTADNPYAVTMTRVGETIGSQIEHINLCKPQPVVEQPAPHILQNR